MDTLAARPFSAQGFRLRAAREENFIIHPDEDGDHRFNPDNVHLIKRTGLRDAAVLIPVVDRGDEATVIMTKRAETLRNHTGQVAFPGGRSDPEDPSPEFTAVRETFEEIGLASDRIEVIGRMPDYVSGSGYRIAPVLAVVSPEFSLAINSEEVDAAFEVPLRFLMDPANHHRGSRFWGEREWFYFDMSYGGQRIWGVTAGIIRTVYERLYA